MNLDVRSSCWKVFASNKWLGALISFGFGVDWWWRVGGGREVMGVRNGEREEREGKEKAVVAI